VKFHRGYIAGVFATIAVALVLTVADLRPPTTVIVSERSKPSADFTTRLNALIDLIETPTTINGTTFDPPNQPVHGTWSKIADFSGGGHEQVRGMAVHNGVLFAGIGGQEDGVGEVVMQREDEWIDVTPGHKHWARIATLLSVGDYLYAGVGSFEHGAQIWRTKDGTSWSLVKDFGLNAKLVFSLTSFGSEICAGVDRKTTNGELWCSGNGWYSPVWTSPADYVYSLNVHRDELYIGTGYPAQVWRYDGSRFEQLIDLSKTGAVPIVETMASYRGHLVIAVGRDFSQDPNAPTVLSYDGREWRPVGITNPGAWKASHNFNASIVFGDTLIVTQGSTYGRTAVWALSDGKNWEKLGGRNSEMGADPFFGTMRGEWIYNIIADGDDLYVGFAGDPGQPSIWKFQLTPTTSQKHHSSEQHVNN
jgi:hypothetical protein